MKNIRCHAKILANVRHIGITPREVQLHAGDLDRNICARNQRVDTIKRDR